MIFAVAGTFTKHIPSGLNIQCAIRKIEAVSGDEAAGKFLRIMTDELPEHGIHVRPIYMTMEDAPQETEEEPETADNSKSAT